MFFSGDLVLLMLFSQTLLSEAGSCPYYYDIQPPLSTNCDPFATNDLAIVCRGCSTNSGGFSIVWNGNNSIPGAEITTSQPVSSNETGEQVWCIESMLTFTGILLYNWLDEYYFCQIMSPGSNISFIPTSSLFLETMPSHDRCPGETALSVNEYACAILQSTMTSTPTILTSTPTIMTSTSTIASTSMITSTSTVASTSAPTTVHSDLNLVLTTGSISSTTPTPVPTVKDGGNMIEEEIYVLGAFSVGIVLLVVSSTFIMMCCCCQCDHFYRRKDGVDDRSIESNKLNLQPKDIMPSTTAYQRKLTETDLAHTQELLEEECCIIAVHNQPSEKPQKPDILRQEAPIHDTQKPYPQKQYTQNHNLQKPYEQKALQTQEHCPHPLNAFSPEQCPTHQDVNGVVPQHFYMWDHQRCKTLPFDAYSSEKGRMRAYSSQNGQNNDELMQRRESLNEQLDEQFQKMSELVHQLSLEVPSPPLNSSYELITVTTLRTQPSRLVSHQPHNVMHSSQQMWSSEHTPHHTSPPTHGYDYPYIRHTDQGMLRNSDGLSHKKLSEGQLPQGLVRPNSNSQLTVSDGRTLHA